MWWNFYAHGFNGHGMDAFILGIFACFKMGNLDIRFLCMITSVAKNLMVYQVYWYKFKLIIKA